MVQVLEKEYEGKVHVKIYRAGKDFDYIPKYGAVTKSMLVINEKKAQIADFDSQLSNAKTLASQYASTIRKQNEVIVQEQARQEKARKEAEAKAKKRNNHQ